MNAEILYTIGVGNSRSQITIYLMQLSLYMMSLDMSKTTQGIILAVVLSSVVSIVAIMTFYYYNSEEATLDGRTRYVRTIEDKSRVFSRVMLGAYGFSMVVLIISYFLKVGVAPYFIYTGPVSLVILLVLTSLHELMMNARYNQLKSSNWVFDYQRTPMIKTLSNKNNVAINMFNSKNHFVADETLDHLSLERVFEEIPTGTKISGANVKKPGYKVMKFTPTFKYNGIKPMKTVYLKHENKEEEKLFDLYLDVLSKYKNLYKVDYGYLACSKTTITINKENIENYIEKSDYVKQFVPTKDAEVGFISIKLSPPLAQMELEEFIQKLGKRVESYELHKKGKNLFVNDPSSGVVNDIDISYLVSYMSMNLDEYKPEKEEARIITKKKEYTSFREKLEDIDVYAVANEKVTEENEEDQFKKHLYRLNIKGELVYLFLQDFKSLSEVDEMLVTKFINRDIEELLERLNVNK